MKSFVGLIQQNTFHMKKLNFYLLTMTIVMAACNAPKPEQASSDSKELSNTINLLIGTYTDDTSKGIYQAQFDPATGDLSDLKLMTESLSPSYLALSRDKNLVYAINELDKGTVSAYKREMDTLLLVNELRTEGIHPCYVDYHETRGLVAVANYTSGDGAVFQKDTAGKLTDVLFTYKHEGTGPNEKRQEGPHAHCSIFSPDGNFVYVVDLGIDQIKGYATNGEQIGQGFTALALQPGDGPRHLVFHPTKQMVFVINELSNTVISATVNPETGVFEVIDRETTLPADFTEHSQCADIHVSADGRFLYGSNRGHNSIVIYKLSDEGELEMLGTESVQGNWPRNFTLSPDEKFLLVANQNSDNIVVFERNAETGLLTATGKELKLSKPVCLKF